MVLALPETYRPLRRVEYDKLVELGVFENERIELIDGVLVPMSSIGPRHSSAVDLLNLFLVRNLGDLARIRVQNPFALNDISEPEPDFLVAPLRDYLYEHPSDAYLVIEVAESSLAFDRGRKMRLYAERNIPEYWVVDVVAKRIEVYRNPERGTYQNVRTVDQSGEIQLLEFPSVTLRVADVLK